MARPAPQRPTVLLVEDEPDVRHSLVDFLHVTMAGVEVVAVPTAEEGLAVLAHLPVSVVVSDYRLPGMDGLRLLGHARAVAPAAARVLVTAFMDVEVAAEELEAAGPLAVLLKPLDAEQFLAEVRRGVQAHLPARSAARPAEAVAGGRIVRGA